ncbi:hypothetical protein DdX_22246 [Ditylenchus destructor]|uniref:Uncharacterized protein n=1 Tax=Ditylenchus destructor TaxID=166010 RepID=A0AAD4MDW2_9BILA|nr:hypothetical protein DdX_22246 [Ditylenchus destructor]
MLDLFLIFTASMHLLLFYNKTVYSNPTPEVFSRTALENTRRVSLNINPISENLNNSDRKFFDFDLKLSPLKPYNTHYSKLLPAKTSARNIRPVIVAQNNYTLNSSEYFNKFIPKSTTYETPTLTYFEIRSEHLYRRVLSPSIEKMLKQHPPYTYIIVPVMNSRNESDEYKTAQETLECYAAMHKYAYRVLYADGTDENSRQVCTQKDVRVLNSISIAVGLIAGFGQ